MTRDIDIRMWSRTTSLYTLWPITHGINRLNVSWSHAVAMAKMDRINAFSWADSYRQSHDSG